jgi:hypothetical protein
LRRQLSLRLRLRIRFRLRLRCLYGRHSLLRCLRRRLRLRRLALRPSALLGLLPVLDCLDVRPLALALVLGRLFALLFFKERALFRVNDPHAAFRLGVVFGDARHL